MAIMKFAYGDIVRVNSGVTTNENNLRGLVVLKQGSIGMIVGTSLSTPDITHYQIKWFVNFPYSNEYHPDHLFFDDTIITKVDGHLAQVLYV